MTAAAWSGAALPRRIGRPTCAARAARPPAPDPPAAGTRLAGWPSSIPAALRHVCRCVPRSLGCGLTGFIRLPCSGPTSGRSGTPVGSTERCCARTSPVSKPSDTRSPPNVACFPERTLARRLDATLPPSEAASEPPAQVPDNDGVSVGALVQQVRQVLGRAHALFGDPASSGGSAAAGAGGRLAGAGDVVRSGQSQISALSGQFAAGYGLFAAGAGLALDDLAGADERLNTRLRFDSVALQQIWF
jgi:hypothetical protein